MQKIVLLGALCACIGLTGAPLRAQEALFAPEVASKSGYELLREASELIKDGPNGEPLATEKLAPDENLRLQRVGAARNAPALAKLREALKAYIVLPEFNNSPPEAGKQHLDALTATRNFARQLSQEAAVRGPIINALSGAGIAASARKSLLQNAKSLNAAQLQTVAARWEKISGHFPTFAQTLRDEEQLQMRLSHQINAVPIAMWNDPAAVAKARAEMKEARANDEMTAEEAREITESFASLEGLTFADINTELRAIFDQGLKRAKQPYFVANTQPPIVASNPFTAFSAEFVRAARDRFSGERNVVSNRLLIAALRLRALKLESGGYPATFEAGTDPFSPTLAPLIYKRVGDSYVLYSVGPDGIDNNGAEIQTLITNDETGAKTVSERLMADSTGDILAPIL